MLYKNLDGTTSEEFSLGKGANKAHMRTVASELEYKDSAGQWHKMAHSPNVDGGGAAEVYFVRAIDGGGANG